MSRVLNILSWLLSALLHPLFCPTYGMVVYMLYMRSRTPELPHLYSGLAIIGTHILTASIPLILLLILKRRQVITSFHITDAKERTTPYAYTTICFAFWSYFVYSTMRLPIVWLIIAVGATIALLAVTIINHWWKISAHLTGIGGLLGGVCSMALYYNFWPLALIIILCLLALLTMYARLYLNAHTPLQVVAGLLLGLLCTFTPTYMLYHA